MPLSSNMVKSEPALKIEHSVCEYSQKANTREGGLSGSIIDQLDSNAVRQTQLSLRQRGKQVGCNLSDRQNPSHLTTPTLSVMLRLAPVTETKACCMYFN